MEECGHHGETLLKQMNNEFVGSARVRQLIDDDIVVCMSMCMSTSRTVAWITYVTITIAS